MKPITGQTVWGAATSGTTTQLDNNFALCINAINDFATYANFLVDTGGANSYVVTLPANATGVLQDGFLLQMRAVNANTGSSTLAYNGGGALNILNIDGSPLAAGAIPANGIVALQYRASDTVWLLQSSGVSASSGAVPVRQTVLSGPMDANGASTMLPLTSANLTVTTANITANAPVVVTAANGFSAAGAVNRIASTSANQTWANLTANSINYLGLRLEANGTVSPVFTANAPVYQNAGTASNGNNNYTFNIQAMSMSLGNGSATAQSWTVFVGEANCNSNAVVSMVSYAYMGRYDSGFTATLPSNATQTTRQHNLGITPELFNFIIECTTAQSGFSIGDRTDYRSFYGSDATSLVWERLNVSRNSMFLQTPAATAFAAINAAGTNTGVTAGNFKYKFTAGRGW